MFKEYFYIFIYIIVLFNDSYLLMYILIDLENYLYIFFYYVRIMFFMVCTIKYYDRHQCILKAITLFSHKLPLMNNLLE